MRRSLLAVVSIAVATTWSSAAQPGAPGPDDGRPDGGAPAPSGPRSTAPSAATLEEQAAQLRERAERLRSEGRFDAAVALAERALGLLEQAYGPGAMAVAQALNNLAALYADVGDYGRAHDQYLRALEIKRALEGPDGPSLVSTFGNLASLADGIGDATQAERYHLEALRIATKHYGPDDLKVGVLLNNYGYMLQHQHRGAAAKERLEQALRIFQRVLGPEHPHIATAFTNLAQLAREAGDYDRAESLYGRAIAMREKLLGPDHPDVAVAMQELAQVVAIRGDSVRAVAMTRRAIALNRQARGAEHFDVAVALSALARLYEHQGEIAKAIATRAEANEVGERNIVAMLGRGAERSLAEMLRQWRGETDLTISLHLRSAPRDRDAARLALLTIVRRKDRVLDLLERWTAVRDSERPSDRELWMRFERARTAYAEWFYAVDGRSERERSIETRRLRDDVEALEEQIQRRSAELDTATVPVTLERVAAGIPADSALVELVRFLPHDVRVADEAQAWARAAHYAAYVLHGDGAVSGVDLGDAAGIDTEVTALRRVLGDPTQDPRPAARALDRSVMAPLVGLLGDKQHVLLAPDDVLALVPFGALVDEHLRYRVERYGFTYLTSGRDLTRPAGAAGLGSSSGDVVVAAPDFGLPPERSISAGANPYRLDRVRFPPLPATAQEAQALGTLLPGSTLLLGEAATETAIKQVRDPRILHIATHGFFLGAQQEAAPRAGTGPATGLPESSSLDRIDGLLRAGLALAGAHRQSSGSDDGWLSAYEAAGLRLGHTELVVLSACESGLGTTTRGEGVRGLRRALGIAGAETQVMSLWKVEDEATRDLMGGYYRRLVAGEGRTAALRAAQRDLFATPAHSHPFYWASFISSGAWQPLRSRPRAKASEVPPAVEPGPRGCACRPAPNAPTERRGALSLGAAAATLIFRATAAAAVPPQAAAIEVRPSLMATVVLREARKIPPAPGTGVPCSVAVLSYEQPLFRPPSEAASLIVQATIGCSHNRCTFCSMYRTKRFRVVPAVELGHALDDARRALGESVRRVFLADGDAMCLSTERLLGILHQLASRFPRLQRVGIYANARDVHAKTDDELRELRHHKLGILYMGLESGDAETLAAVHKGATVAEIVEATRRAQTAGMRVSCMVLIGLGGDARSLQHARASAEAVNRMAPHYTSLLTYTPTPGSELGKAVIQGDFILPSPAQSVREIREFVAHLGCQTTFSCNHASNYLPLTGTMPEDKDEILAALDAGIEGRRRLKPEFLRGL